MMKLLCQMNPTLVLYVKLSTSITGYLRYVVWAGDGLREGDKSFSTENQQDKFPWSQEAGIKAKVKS
jgi:hypothetical protein